MALNGLGRYADAIFVLRQLVSREPEDQAAQHALAECQMLQEQAFMGKYDMPALLFGRLHAPHAAALAVAAARAPPQRG